MWMWRRDIGDFVWLFSDSITAWYAKETSENRLELATLPGSRTKKVIWVFLSKTVQNKKSLQKKQQRKSNMIPLLCCMHLAWFCVISINKSSSLTKQSAGLFCPDFIRIKFQISLRKFTVLFPRDARRPSLFPPHGLKQIACVTNGQKYCKFPKIVVCETGYIIYSLDAASTKKHAIRLWCL